MSISQSWHQHLLIFYNFIIFQQFWLFIYFFNFLRWFLYFFHLFHFFRNFKFDFWFLWFDIDIYYICFWCCRGFTFTFARRCTWFNKGECGLFFNFLLSSFRTFFGRFLFWFRLWLFLHFLLLLNIFQLSSFNFFIVISCSRWFLCAWSSTWLYFFPLNRWHKTIITRLFIFFFFLVQL